MTKLSTTKTMILAAFASTALVAVALPAVASADCYDRRQDAGTNGAVAGAVIGGAIGGSTSGHREKGTGTVAGAVVGAMIGSSIARDNTRCRGDYAYDRGYGDRGYYDNGGYRGGVVVEDETTIYHDNRYGRDDHRDWYDDRGTHWIWREHDHRWERR